MGYRTCYLCKHWDEDSGLCSVHNTVKDESDWCPSITLIPCCASCKFWSENDDYPKQGNCRVYGNRLSPATSICRENNYEER